MLFDSGGCDESCAAANWSFLGTRTGHCTITVLALEFWYFLFPGCLVLFEVAGTGEPGRTHNSVAL